MKSFRTKIFFIGAFIFAVLCIPTDASAQVMLVAGNDELETLQARVAELTAQLAALQGKPAVGISISPVWTGEKRNLDVGRIRWVRKNEDNESNDETLAIYVKSGRYGFSNITGERAGYEVYLYEVRNGRNIKVQKEPITAGIFLVPQARGTIEFRAKIPTEFLTSDTTYQAEVHIDTARAIEETNERDNKGLSPVWTASE